MIADGDIRYVIYEKYSFLIGILSISVNRLLYGGRLIITPPYRVWGGIRFLIHGPGSITIGKDFHAVSARRRSFHTLFSPCHLTVIGDGCIVIGEHVGLNGTTIAARKKVTIGDNTMIAANTVIMDHDGHALWPPSERWSNPGPTAEVIIERDVWIGMNCIILKGVRIGSGAVIASGSVVVSDVDSASLYAGNPAKKVKSLNG